MPLASSLKHWKSWGLNTKPRLIKTFTSGQNHSTGLIEVGNDRYVLKIFDHSFEQAMKAEYLANQLNVSPKVIYAGDNVALFDYIPSAAVPEITLVELAQTLAKVHSDKATSLEKFDLLTFCQTYLGTADELTLAWHQTLLPALNHFVNDSTPWCFCHNDLVQENCLINDKLYLIDWEFAQQHNPWFDLAAIVVYFRLDEQQSSEFLNLYQAGWQKKMQDHIFYTSQISLLWGDLLWNMHKFGNDYRTDNTDRFDRLIQLAAKLEIDLTPQTQ